MAKLRALSFAVQHLEIAHCPEPNEPIGIASLYLYCLEVHLGASIRYV